MSNTAAIPALVIRRTYPVPRERAYEAWTNPEIAATFLGPGDVIAKNVKMDVRVGGSYSLTMANTKAGDLDVGGTYSVVVPNEKLAMTWRWKEDDPKDEIDTLLTLEFYDVPGGCELVLTHENFGSVESRDNHEGGWGEIMDELGVALRR